MNTGKKPKDFTLINIIHRPIIQISSQVHFIKIFLLQVVIIYIQLKPLNLLHSHMDSVTCLG